MIRVRGRTQRRFSVAALACYKAGERSRLIFRPSLRGRHDSSARRSLAWTGYRGLLTAAHHQLGAPMVVIWDNLKCATRRYGIAWG
ncbi:hypothetical protein [Streptomyces paromomycinus]|uniref:Transposase n=1 Tax=Streptomyces paromomycinus TaxID=92743 RepID=A0A401VUQ9_STREY|nr:hypothetical protein [Streptomyces paromomycinus]GCD40799.1 hypothetical protein GKJPGBOP_00452 [Streptomyces paromomycinus]